ncbi:DUF1217 domain-containing protein [Marinivivus vitaminiproducens]|uniref:DUF1217 domain-containing protein n=1 Tax=Marinivivus vitaminiproducens TaxID=3035935 RepID=UPI00279C0E34|nr:DUF1217 domain-containing protein [Geminicoccaceae bacterium SCSIO 64248]
MIVGFRALVPTGGLAGWRLLDRTLDSQLARAAASPAIARDVAYMEAHLPETTTAQDLVDDPRLLRIVATAFGLESEVPKKAFLRKVLESDLGDPSSFANRLTDRRYRTMAVALGLSGASGEPSTADPALLKQIGGDYVVTRFESDVGEQNEPLRLALHFRRTIGAIANAASADTSGWFAVMGQPPVREVLQTALGLPDGIGKLDIDRQKALYEAASRKLLGSPSVRALADPAKVDAVITRFVARAGLAEAAPAAGGVALLLGGGSVGAAGIMSILAARAG